ncbi:MAG TPA: [protein-PII] uridylyltransferase [Candidatus Dormibacteraeota bacterium]|nr:[protein-PII] uridylyltransferase [Candidatus Dormibacteraeota bacterium]
MNRESRISTLQDRYAGESARIRNHFEDSGDGKAAIRDRSALIDSVVIELWKDLTGAGERVEGFCILAMGGYGRCTLFPYSDIDLLFLYEKEGSGEHFSKKIIAPLSQSLWDLHLRVSPTTRTLAECGKLHRGNIEFNISLLDCRYICGDEKLYERLRSRVLPGMISRESQNLMQELIGLARSRHEKYGQTIFHLEPNIKDGPGGLRDYQVACWLAQIEEMKRSREWKDANGLLPIPLRSDVFSAIDFLDSVRCFLHYRQGRDLNGLTYEMQSEAASKGIGLHGGRAASPNEWMRDYFRHARAIDRLAVLLDEVPRSKTVWSRVLSFRGSPLSNSELTVVDGRVSLNRPGSVEDPEVMFRLFELVARHNLKLTAETENTVAAALPRMQKWVASTADLWEHLRKILVLPYAAVALRAMHRLGYLILLFKEFQAIDSLVIRDYYHRYTVDEHSLVTIENLHNLRSGKSALDRRFWDILSTIEHPELLYLSLLFHDVGKGMPFESHVEGSLLAVQGIFERLRLDSLDRETVNFLIGSHLRMSATLMRRDIFDPEAVHDFAQIVGTIERLKLLTLFTFADIKAVNPEALTPWKAEMLWQLYAATENYLNRSVDDQRLYLAGEDTKQLERLIPTGEDAAESEQFRNFLDGFPKRYLLTHSSSEISAHYRMYRRLGHSVAEISITKRNEYYELVLVTTDRQFLFAKVAGTISSWGMNILKADACANKNGIVLDALRFSDRFRTLDHNPSEASRLKQQLVAAISGELDVEDLMERKFLPEKRPPKVRVDTRIHMDNDCSSHSTVVEIVTQDRPGLLYEISSTFAELGFNIDVGLIDTEGGTATDVFYVTQKGEKLSLDRLHELQSALERRL